MAWWNSSWTKKQAITITGGASGAQNAYQVKLTVAWDSDMAADFSDLRFTNAAEDALLDSWMESHIASTSAVVWVETDTPANAVEVNIYMYYGNAGASSDWDGAATFLQYHGAASAGFIDSLNTPYSCVYEVRAKPTSSAANVHFGVSSAYDRSDDEMVITLKKSINVVGHVCRNEGSETYISEAEAIVVDQWYRGSVYNSGSASYGNWDGDQIVSGITTNRPNENVGLYMRIFGGTAEQDWSFSRKYAANPPTYEFGVEESVPTGGTRLPRAFHGPFHGPLGGPI